MYYVLYVISFIMFLLLYNDVETDYYVSTFKSRYKHMISALNLVNTNRSPYSTHVSELSNKLPV